VLERSKNREVPRYAVFSTILLPHPPLVQISSSATCSQTPSVHVPPLVRDQFSHSYRSTGKITVVYNPIS
jgi:hypothetical protein